MTKLKLMELSLIESREIAIAATKTKSRFLANMSHEIRTPLNGVVGSAVLLMETTLSPEQRELAETIKSSSDSLLLLIDDILDFSKIEAGKLNVEMLPFDPMVVIHEAVKTVSKRAAEKAIGLELVIQNDVPEQIMSDPLRFRQIVLNLLSNAVKFTDVGQVRLEVSHRMLSESRLELMLRFHDTGIGMSPEQQEKLFKDFTQVDGSTTRKYGGSGLGLAICKQLCNLLGGSIEVQSELGKGSTFTFRITAALGQKSAPLAGSEKPETPAMILPQSSGLRILVAEDNRTNQLIVKQFLKKLNLDADRVEHGLAAVEAVKARSYDLVFMDIHMPVLDGYDATRAIRAALPKDRQPYILALTANVMKEDKDLCEAAGMDGFLKKPLDLSELVLAINKFCSLRPSAQQDALSEAYNPSAALARFQGDYEILQHAAGLFLDECKQKVEEMQKAMDRQDTRAVQKIARALKGAASYFSTDAVTTVAKDMEDVAKLGKLEELRRLFPRLKAEAEQLTQALARFLNEKKSA